MKTGIGISRASELYNHKGKKGRLGIGKTKFNEDYVHHPDRPDERECVPGTDVLRLKPVPLGEKAIGFLDDEVDALVEGIRAERDKELRERDRRPRTGKNTKASTAAEAR
jgi:hypothetical protein